MPHSFASNLIHCVFSTKGREPMIAAGLQEKLWAYLTGTGKHLGYALLATRGTENHVHVLFSLPATVPLSTAVQKLKANSSRWMAEHGIAFQWQKGYGAFSVSPSQIPVVKAYIENQAEHHRKRNFEQELVALLKKAGVAYDPRYVFG